MGSSTPWSPTSPHHIGDVGVAFDRRHSLGSPDKQPFDAPFALPIRTPVNASPVASRRPTHDSGREWWLTSTPYRTLTGYPLPVSLAHARMVAKPPLAARYIGVLQTMSLPPSSAPTATGWSDSCRAGFAPAEEWRLSRRTQKTVLSPATVPVVGRAGVAIGLAPRPPAAQRRVVPGN